MTLTATSNWFTDDTLFKSELTQGANWQLWAGIQLLKHGLAVRVPDPQPMHFDLPINVRRAKYRGSQDIWVGSVTPKYPVEVKSRNEVFTEPRDFPYPSVLVMPVDHWDRMAEKPIATIYISRPTGTLLVIPTTTKVLWTVRTITDRRRGTIETCWEAPTSTLLPLDWFVYHLQLHP